MSRRDDRDSGHGRRHLSDCLDRAARSGPPPSAPAPPPDTDAAGSRKKEDAGSYHLSDCLDRRGVAKRSGDGDDAGRHREDTSSGGDGRRRRFDEEKGGKRRRHEDRDRDEEDGRRRRRSNEREETKSSTSKAPSKSDDVLDVLARWSQPPPKPKTVSLKLGPAPAMKAKTGDSFAGTLMKPKTAGVAKAFGDDSDSDEEEMPPEAKMRMKNLGRFTPTSAGPNSFGKTKAGFCDQKSLFERKLTEVGKHLSGD